MSNWNGKVFSRWPKISLHWRQLLSIAKILFSKVLLIIQDFILCEKFAIVSHLVCFTWHSIRQYSKLNFDDKTTKFHRNIYAKYSLYSQDMFYRVSVLWHTISTRLSSIFEKLPHCDSNLYWKTCLNCLKMCTKKSQRRRVLFEGECSKIE